MKRPYEPPTITSERQPTIPVVMLLGSMVVLGLHLAAKRHEEATQ